MTTPNDHRSDDDRSNEIAQPDHRLHVILGKGPVGSATAALLTARGDKVRVLSRSGGGGVGDAVEHVAVDAADAAALTAACEGADVIYNCANPVDYHRWAELWPPMAHALLAAAEATGAVLATVGNLYGYGRVDRPITADTPLSAEGAKGRVRVQMWDEALERHREGRVRVVEVRRLLRTRRHRRRAPRGARRATAARRQAGPAARPVRRPPQLHLCARRRSCARACRW